MDCMPALCVGWEVVRSNTAEERRWVAGGDFLMYVWRRTLRAAALVANVLRVSAVCSVRQHLQVASHWVDYLLGSIVPCCNAAAVTGLHKTPGLFAMDTHLAGARLL